ncbi:MAG: DUF4908 domain-containing protein [Alphaproteobacteria bacterium]
MSRRAFIHGLGAAILFAGAATTARAQPPAPGKPPPPGSPLNRLFTQREPGSPPIAHFVAGEVEFTFDRSSGQALLQLGRNGEVLALSRSLGPRNAQIFKNDVGEQVLILTNLGGFTLYTRVNPGGVPASPVPGPAAPIHLASVRDTDDFARRKQLVANRMAAVLGRFVGVGVVENPQAWSLVADELELAAQIFEKNQDQIKSDPRFQHINRLLVVEGDQPDVVMIYDTVQIVIDPDRGVAGRPSSAMIAQRLRLNERGSTIQALAR